MAGDAPVLTKNQQKRALTGKKTKKCIRNTLVNPYDISWPMVKPEDEHGLLQLMKELTAKIKRPKLKIELSSIRNLAKKDRRALRRQKRQQLMQDMGMEDSQELRDHLVMGVNHLARSIEKGEVVSAVIARDVDPPMLTKFLVPLATTRHLPLLALSGMARVTEEALGFRCVALGLKGEASSADNHFHPLHSRIKELSRALPTPSWMSRPVLPAPAEGTATRVETAPTAEEGTSSSEPKTERKEEPCPYLYRTSSKQRAFAPPRKLKPEFPNAGNNSDEENTEKTKASIPMCIPKFISHSLGPTVKRQPGQHEKPKSRQSLEPGASSQTGITGKAVASKKGKSKKRKRAAEVAYKPMKIKKVQSNPNKRTT